MSVSSGLPGSSARPTPASANRTTATDDQRMGRALAQARAAAEGSDGRAPQVHFFVARGTADRRELPAFSACARGTSVAAPRPARATRSTLRGTPMEENAGNLVRTLRQKLGMTQEEFAHEIAVTVSTVNRWENAHAEPSKLAWKAIQDLARKRGLPDDVALRSALEN